MTFYVEKFLFRRAKQERIFVVMMNLKERIITPPQKKRHFLHYFLAYKAQEPLMVEG